MEQVHVTARFSIPGEHLSEFRTLSREMVNQVELSEPNTLQYLWYFNDDLTECVVKEIYANSEAVLFHLSNCEKTLARILEIAPIELEIFGQISEELAQGAAQLKAKRYGYHTGVNRLSK